MLSGSLDAAGKLCLAYFHLNFIEFVALSASETSLVRSVMMIGSCAPDCSLMYISFVSSSCEIWLACSKKSIEDSTSCSYADLSSQNVVSPRHVAVELQLRHHVDGTQAQRGIIDRVFFKPNNTRYRFTGSVNETFRVASESLVRESQERNALPCIAWQHER